MEFFIFYWNVTKTKSTQDALYGPIQDFVEKNLYHLFLHIVKACCTWAYLYFISKKDKKTNSSSQTEYLFFFRVLLDFVLYAVYICTYVFYFFPKKEYNRKKAALDSDYGWHLTFMSVQATIMIITFIIVENFVYWFSVREARKRAIYQEFNRKEKFWSKGESHPRVDRAVEIQYFEKMQFNSDN